MKKFLFSALTCVAFATTGFASNETNEVNNSFYNNVESYSLKNFNIEKVLEISSFKLSNYPCQFSISVLAPDGELLEFHWVIGKEGGEPCLNRMIEDAAMLQGMFPEAVLEFDIIAM